MTVRTIAIASLVLAACAAKPAPLPCGPTPDQTAAARRAIEATNDHALELMRRGDIAASAALFTPDGEFMGGDSPEPIRGRAAIQADWQSLAGKVKDLAAPVTELEIYGDVAYLMSIEEFKMVGGGGFRGKSVNILKRQSDGSWLFYRDIFQPLSDDAKPGDAAPPSTPQSAAPAPCPATPNDAAAVRRQIEETEARNLEALKRGDAEAYAAAFAPDGAYLSMKVVEPIRGRGAIAAWVKPSLEKFKNREQTVKEVEVYGSAAYEMGTELIVLPHVKYHTKYIAMWKLQPDGTWQIFRRIHTTASEAVPTSAAWSEALSDDEKTAIMKLRVSPALAKVFQTEDPKQFASFDCGTCHGDGKDPRDVLPKLTMKDGKLTAFAEKPAAAKFMQEKIVPAMAEALGVPANDPMVGCGGCHKIEQKN
jgi:ketosteroid isomerase-like protein